MNDLLSPAEVLDYTALADCLPSAAGEGCGDGGTDEGAGRGAGGASLDVAHPARDYIPPELVTLFLTDAGGRCRDSSRRCWERFTRCRRIGPSERVGKGDGGSVEGRGL